jgi:hypothetical protein
MNLMQSVREETRLNHRLFERHHQSFYKNQSLNHADYVCVAFACQLYTLDKIERSKIQEV